MGDQALGDAGLRVFQDVDGVADALGNAGFTNA